MPTSSLVLARLRLRVPRRAVPYWAAAGVLLVLSVLVISGMARRARSRQAALGPPVSVVVATADVAAGGPLDGHVRVEERPRSLVPRGALSTVPAGRVATAYIANGEVVLTPRVSGTPAAGPAALVPAGERALTVPVGNVASPAAVGDRVDVLATPVAGEAEPLATTSDASRADTTVGTAAPSATVVAHAALVVATGPDGVTVAVPVADAPALATAIARATVTLALTAPGAR